MSHQVFVDKMLSELSTPMVFLKESSFVFASNGRRWHWCLCSRGALTASLFARSKQEHPTPNKNTLPKQRHPTQTTTTLKRGHPAQTRTSCRNKDTPHERGHPARTRTPCPNKDTLLKRQPRPNEDIPPKPGHPAETRTPRTNKDTPPERGHPAETRTPARTKRFGKFLLNLPG